MAVPDEKLIDDLEWRGLVHQMTDPALPELLAREQVTVYIGFDPTAESLHVGSLQQLVMLKRFARAGHRPIALVGGGTGMIGDPSGKSEERSLLDSDALAANVKGVHRQMAGFLGEKAILANNADWLADAGLIEFLRDVGKLFSVNEMVRKDSVRNRLEGREQGISFTEFSYQLCQAWDFVKLYDKYGCTLQLGGSDQFGNIAEGVALLRRMRQATGYGLTSPLVTKADGTKFGKTESGNVWLSADRTSPYNFYQFWVRVPDSDVSSYLRRFTFLDQGEIEALDAELAAHPERREAQRALAQELTTMVHGAEETIRAEKAAAVLFTDEVTSLDEATLRSVLSDAPTTEIDGSALSGAGLGLVDAIVDAGLAPSKGRARKDIAGGGIYLNGRRATDPERVIGAGDLLHGRWVLLRRGRATQHVLVAGR